MSSVVSNRSEREPMSPADKGMQDRRVLRLIDQKLTMNRMQKITGLSANRINAIAAEYGREIVKAKTGSRW